MHVADAGGLQSLSMLSMSLCLTILAAATATADLLCCCIYVAEPTAAILPAFLEVRLVQLRPCWARMLAVSSKHLRTCRARIRHLRSKPTVDPKTVQKWEKAVVDILVVRRFGWFLGWCNDINKEALSSRLTIGCL